MNIRDNKGQKMTHDKGKKDIVWLIFFVAFLSATLLSIVFSFLTFHNTTILGILRIGAEQDTEEDNNTEAFWTDKTAYSVEITDEDTLSAFYAYQEHDDGAISEEEKSDSLDIVNLWNNVVDKIDTYADEYTFSADSFILLNAYVKEKTGLHADDIDSYEYELMQTSNGYWMEPTEYGDCTEAVENTIEFSEYLNDLGIYFVYLETPYKFDQEAYEEAGGVGEDYSEQISDEVNADLRAAGVSVLSMEEMVEEDDMDRLSLFYKTDHHWLPQTALRSASLLGDYLNENCGFQMDTSLFELDNYTITTFDNYYLGSYGRKVTTVLAEKDDFDILTPNYETDLTVYSSDNNNVLRGNIQGTLLYQEWLVDEVTEENVYCYYGDGDQGLIQAHNNNISDGSRLLVLKVSTSNCLIPYLAAAVEYLDAIDLRAYDGSLKDFIDTTNPDAVVMIYQGNQFDPEYSKYNKAAFDFE